MSKATLPKTWEEISAIAGIDPKALLDVTSFPERLHKFLIANFQIAIIAEVLNKVSAASPDEPQWKPQWNNWEQRKYSPWFDIEADDKVPSGFGFSGTGYDNTTTGTNVGSRLLFRSSELALYAAETFADIYKDLILMD